MEFHVSRQARERYQFDQSLFSLSGNVIFANLRAARAFAQKINQKRDVVHFPEQSIRAGELNAMGLIDEILHLVVGIYRQERSPQMLEGALAWVKERVGSREVERALVEFATQFPPVSVYSGKQSLAEYLEGETEGIPNQQVLLEEMLMLWLENKNPAFDPFEEFFNDEVLSAESVYPHIMAELHRFFDTQPSFGPQQQNLIDMLRSPAVAVPYSLAGQIEYIRTNWSELLGRYLSALLGRLLTSLDLIREEEMQRGMGGPGPVPVPVYDAAMREFEAENFSPDREWMPRLVLIAKNTYVWLDQLSKEYGRTIDRLDLIPDEELQKLGSWGITGLWLIGLWERSRASARIKQLMGNPEAIASAYSLYDYGIAGDLGGEEAYRTLRDKAWHFGIRLASDMVPNHMGIDSPWVVEHPDWFLSLDYSPFPSYTFSGPDLSNDSRASMYIEDHYFTKTDASVVFKDIDHRDGHERYIYHGNDGTTMPWNDTAQLNYLKAEVREAVIQTILSVARRFPIIRFDAAMTLAKLHYQRLWFPTPGTGGAIPSRADFSLTKEQFDQAMPIEFWREVVDRVAQEAPDTLLLAEAFWLMESYFVRTLGMHRVYNSAFMNILRNEENSKYRLIMKNTLEFDPEILKRYVNFMNNPDERTAVDQFGKGDKYFGICTLLATMPGLPMFGHGQVEGYSEKYGMEFKRAYWDENPDPGLVERHKREIFPLLHRRALFAGVDNFLLYDFFTPQGEVNEDVYAYSNGLGNERGLVVYHNKFGDTQGWVRMSVGFSVKGSDGERTVIQRSLGEGLNLAGDPGMYCIFRDLSAGLEYIRPSQEIIEQGLFLSLHAYEYHTFIDFHEALDDEWGSYGKLNEYLAGRGVPSVQGALQELLLQPVLEPLRAIFNPGYFRYLLDSRLCSVEAVLPAGLLDEAAGKLSRLLDGIELMTGGGTDPLAREHLLREIGSGLRLALSLPTLEERYPLPGSKKYPLVVEYLQSGLSAQEDGDWVLLFAWLFLHNLGQMGSSPEFEVTTSAWIDEWLFGRILADAARDMGLPEASIQDLSAVLKMLVAQQCWWERATRPAPATAAETQTPPVQPAADQPAVGTATGQKPVGQILEAWLADEEIQRYLKVNRYNNVLWFDKGRFESFVWWMVMLAVLATVTGPRASASLLVERLLMVYSMATRLLEAEAKSDYQVAKLLKAAIKE
jgi:glycosidase